MGNDRQGLIWPLALVFLLTTCGAFLGFVLAATNHNFDKRVAAILLGAALVSGLVLYIPRIWLNAKVPSFDKMDERITAVHRTLLGKEGDADAVAAIAVKLEAQIASVDAKLSARLDTIEAKLPKQT